MKKKILSLALALLMILSLMPTMALAEGNVSVSSFEDLKAALSSAETSLTISVSGSIDVTETLVISGNKTVTIDGGNTAVFNRVGGKDVTFFSVEKGSSLTLKNFTVEGNCMDWQSGNNSFQTASDAITGTKPIISSAGNVTVDAVVFQNLVNTKNEVVLYSCGEADAHTKVQFINNCEVKNCATNGSGLFVRALYSDVTLGTKDVCGANVHDCFGTGRGAFVYLSDTGQVNLTIENAVFKDNLFYGGNNAGMIYSIWNVSHIVVNGGLFEGNEGHGNNSAIIRGCPNTDITINGGTFKDNKVDCLFATAISGYNDADILLTINGGEFSIPNDDYGFVLNAGGEVVIGPDAVITGANLTTLFMAYWKYDCSVTINGKYEGDFYYYPNSVGLITIGETGCHTGSIGALTSYGTNFFNGKTYYWHKNSEKSTVSFEEGVGYSAYSKNLDCYFGCWYEDTYGIGAMQHVKEDDLLVLGANNSFTPTEDQLIAMHLWVDMNGFTFNGSEAFPESLVDYDNGWRVIDHGDGLYEITDRFTRIYKSNYDGGAEDDSDFVMATVETPVALKANPFTRTGFEFKGWATEPDGEVVYADGAVPEKNESLVLYAVWAKPIPVSSDDFEAELTEKPTAAKAADSVPADIPVNDPEELSKASVAGVADAIKDSVLQEIVNNAIEKNPEADAVEVVVEKSVTLEAVAFDEDEAVEKLVYHVMPNGTVITYLNGEEISREPVIIKNSDIKDEAFFLVTLPCKGMTPKSIIHSEGDNIIDVFNEGDFDYDEVNDTVTVRISQFSKLTLLTTPTEENGVQLIGTDGKVIRSYKTFAEAAIVVENGQTIRLLKDCTEGATYLMPLAENASNTFTFSIDYNGYNFNGTIEPDEDYTQVGGVVVSGTVHTYKFVKNAAPDEPDDDNTSGIFGFFGKLFSFILTDKFMDDMKAVAIFSLFTNAMSNMMNVLFGYVNQ